MGGFRTRTHEGGVVWLGKKVELLLFRHHRSKASHLLSPFNSGVPSKNNPAAAASDNKGSTTLSSSTSKRFFYTRKNSFSPNPTEEGGGKRFGFEQRRRRRRIMGRKNSFFSSGLLFGLCRRRRGGIFAWALEMPPSLSFLLFLVTPRWPGRGKRKKEGGVGRQGNERRKRRYAWKKEADFWWGKNRTAP